ncbi:SAC3/GANP/Nin1/mts3/eIF-3 p25 family-domain-containing protein, partial [Hyaloraphidium curvatum]
MRAEAEKGRADRFASDIQLLYNKLKAERERKRAEYIRQGKIADPEAKQQLQDAIDLVGECPDMCPEFERVDREMSGTVDPLEKASCGARLASPGAVKRFKRSSAGDGQPLPCDVRPPPVLLLTIDYLIREVMGNHPLETCHRFVGDRLRAVANDFIVQNYRGREAIRCTEVISRYYIVALHALGEMTEDQGVSHKQDLKMLMDNLKTLTEMYQDFHAMEPGEVLDNEAEFYGYFLLAHPTSHSDVGFLERTVSRRILVSPEVRLAIELRELMQRSQRAAVRGYRSEGSHRSMATFFRRLREDPRSTALVAMVAELQFGDVRRDGLQAMDRAYKPSYHFPLQTLADWMGLDSVEQAFAWVEECGLEVSSAA